MSCGKTSMDISTWIRVALYFVSTSVTVVKGTNLGDWYFVDVHAVVCPGAPGYTTVELPIPAEQEFDPSIFSFFRTSTQSVTISFVAKDGAGTLVAQESALVLQPNTVTSGGRRLANSSFVMESDPLEKENNSPIEDDISVEDDLKVRRLSARRRSSYSSYSSRSRSYSSSSRSRSYYSPPRRRTYYSPPRRRTYYSPPRRRTYYSPPRRRTYYSPPRRRAYYSPPRRRRRSPPPTRRRTYSAPRWRRRRYSNSYSPPRRRRRGGSSFSPPRRRRRGVSSSSPPRRRRRGGSSGGGSSSSPPRRRRRGGTSFSPPRRRRRGVSSSSPPRRRRRGGSSGGGSSSSPPRRRRRGGSSVSPPRRRRRMYPPRRRIALNTATHRRRGAPQSPMNIPRRRYSGYNGGRYSNSHNPNAGYYGYQNEQSAFNNYAPGYLPMQAPYGYHGTAYQPNGGMGTGTKIALAAGGGLLVGGLGGALIANSMNDDDHHDHYNQWGSYPQWNGMADRCTTSQIPGWTGPCQNCMAAYPPSTCFSEFHPPSSFYRDDIMGTGFIPADYTSPIKLQITGIIGADFQAANICGQWIDGQEPTTPTTTLAGNLSADTATTEPLANATGRRLEFTPPDSQLLFVSLATVGELDDERGLSPPAPPPTSPPGVYPPYYPPSDAQYISPLSDGQNVNPPPNGQNNNLPPNGQDNNLPPNGEKIYPPLDVDSPSNGQNFNEPQPGGNMIGPLLLVCCCGYCLCAIIAAAVMAGQKKNRQEDDSSSEEILLTPQGPPGGIEGGGEGFMARAPVAPNVAAEFINFLRQEYVYGQEGAVGPFFDSLDGDEPNILGPYEEQVRDAPDKQAAIDDIERSWS